MVATTPEAALLCIVHQKKRRGANIFPGGRSYAFFALPKNEMPGCRLGAGFRLVRCTGDFCNGDGRGPLV
ncbi:MAG: hypothetical protein D6741_19740, partial [Planctomycetota bacterium]